VVEGARLENETGEQYQATPKRLNAKAISDLALQNDRSCAHVPGSRATAHHPENFMKFSVRLLSLSERSSRRRRAHLAQDRRQQVVDLAEQADREDVGQH
jgi:hypothetical protein